MEVEVKYEGYIRRQDEELAREADAFDAASIPPNLDFAGIRGLSHEAIEKLSRQRPTSVAQARRIPGVTPAALSLVLIHLKRANAL